MSDEINLTELREWAESAKPLPTEARDDGGPVWTDAALLAEDRLVVALLNGGAVALIDAAEALHELDSELLEDWESTPRAKAALAKFEFGEPS